MSTSRPSGVISALWMVPLTDFRETIIREFARLSPGASVSSSQTPSIVMLSLVRLWLCCQVNAIIRSPSAQDGAPGS